MIVRLLLWSLADSQTTLDELRAKLPELEPPSVWISNEATERFGLVAYGEIPADTLELAAVLIGKQPEAGEEFDVEVAP
jgi:hypothetical protein